MRIKADEFENLRSWSACFIQYAMPFVADLSPEVHPIAVLDEIAATSPSRARQGLAMMIGDLVEVSAGLSSDHVGALEAKLAAAELPSLSVMRLRLRKLVGSQDEY